MDLPIESSTFSALAEKNNCNAQRAILNQKIRQQMNSPVRFVSHAGTSQIYWEIKNGEKILKRLKAKNKIIDSSRSLFYFFKK